MKPMVCLVLLTALSLFGADINALDPKLEGLKPFLGNWRGEFPKSTPEKPLVDVAQWERALNGKAVRVLHSINNGAYGGETIILWDEKANALVYHYFTTAGFHTRGTMKILGQKLECHEIVSGQAQGTSEVKSSYELTADGSMNSEARYLRNGQWTEGRHVKYHRVNHGPVFK